MYHVAVTADIEKAFLQVRIREYERDALRFHWQCGEQSELDSFYKNIIWVSPIPLPSGGGVIDCHLALLEHTVGVKRMSPVSVFCQTFRKLYVVT